jgi:hypothetical protein
VEIRNTAIDPHELEELRKTIVVPSICTMNPNITFKENLFCFTGISQKSNRESIINKIVSLDGVYNNITKKPITWSLVTRIIYVEFFRVMGGKLKRRWKIEEPD